MKHKQRSWPGVLLLTVAIVLAACGPAVASSTAPNEAAELITAAEATPAAPENASPTARSELEIETSPSQTDAKGVLVGFTEDGHAYRGNPEAPVVIEEFSDFQCPFCSRFHAQTLPSLDKNQITNGEVLLIYYDFPLSSIHPQATLAAVAARCAGAQGAPAFWAMHDLLFAQPDQWGNNGATAVFNQYAADLGLDTAAFSSCLSNQTHLDAVNADVALGQSRGVSSTPSFFINNQPVIGAQPLNVFDQAIATIKEGGQIAGNQPQQQPAAIPTPATIPLDNIVAERGRANAPVTIVEYTDYQCPYCQRHASETFPQILSQLVETGRVHYVLKDFPLEAIHPEARQAAVAARCASEQNGGYWPMHDTLFANQQQWAGLGAGATEIFTNLAISVGLDGDKFRACLADNAYGGAIDAHLSEGALLGVRGTPAFFINGFPVNGAQPYELFAYAVGLAEEGRLAEAYRPREQAQQPPPEPQGPVEVPIGDAFSMGDPNAPVVIVEYTDFQCPFCRRHFLETYGQLKLEFIDTGQVRYVFKDFPLADIHPQAQLAAEAARCAGEQNGFLAMHDQLFAAQESWNGRADAATFFGQYAGQMGLDSDAFSECLSSRKYETAVQADFNEGVSLGVRGTPAFFINGIFINGAQPYSAFVQAINEQLASAD